MSPSDVQIKIFDQSITFYNPGRLYGRVTIEDLKKDNYTSDLRNKLIAEAFYLTKDIEKYGTGFFRVRNEIKEYPTMVFQYHEQGNGFIAELAYTKQKTSTVIPYDTVSNDRFLQILETIQSDKRISIIRLSKKLGVSRMTIVRDLDKLKEQGRLIRIGSDKTGYWQIL